MKRKAIFVVLAVIIFLPVLLSAEEKMTITTYYPSPSGSYKDLSAETLTINKAIYKPIIREDAGPCSEDDGDTIVGATYYDANDNLIYFCDGIQWKPIEGVSSSGGDPLNIAGVTIASWVTQTGDHYSSEEYNVIGSLKPCGDYGDGCVHNNGYPDWGNRIRINDVDRFDINLRGLPKANYIYSLQGTVDIDQWLEVTEINKRNRSSSADSWHNQADVPLVLSNAEYQNVIAATKARVVTDSRVKAFYRVQRYASSGWVSKISSETLFDSNYFEKAGSTLLNSDWVNAANFVTFEIEKDGQEFWGAFPNTADNQWKLYRIYLDKNAGYANNTGWFYYPSEPSNLQYRVYYKWGLKLRFSNLEFDAKGDFAPLTP